VVQLLSGFQAATCIGLIRASTKTPQFQMPKSKCQKKFKWLNVKTSRCTEEEFPEFSKKEISNPLMFQHNFESLGGTLISLRSLALALTL
jgi:hypothetical protein